MSKAASFDSFAMDGSSAGYLLLQRYRVGFLGLAVMTYYFWGKRDFQNSTVGKLANVPDLAIKALLIYWNIKLSWAINQLASKDIMSAH